MIIRYNATGEGRKRLAYELGKITLWEPVYAKAPTFAYKVGNYTVDKTGAVICPTGMTKDVLDRLISLLKEQGFEKIAVDGISKGSEYALLAASRFDDISCVIARVPSYFVSEGMIGRSGPSGTSC